MTLLRRDHQEKSKTLFGPSSFLGVKMWVQGLDLKQPCWPMTWKPHDEENGAVMKNLGFGDLKKHSCHMGRGRESMFNSVYHYYF